MNRIFKNFSIVTFFVLGVCYASSALARYELPAEYKKNEDIADKAVTAARAKALDAIKSLQGLIKEFSVIIQNGVADDELVDEMLKEIRRLEAQQGSSSNNSAKSGADWQRKILAWIASEKGNGFNKLDKNTVAKIVTAIEKNVPDAASDNKWAPVLNAAKKAAK